MDINQKKFEKKLLKYYFYFEKNKELFEQVAIMTRIFNKNNLDIKFLNEVYKKNYFSRRILESILEYSYFKISKDIKNIENLSLYEKEIIKNGTKKFDLKKELILNQLKVLYFLSPYIGKIKTFEKDNEIIIHDAIFFKKNFNSVLIKLLNLNYEFLMNIKFLKNKYILRSYVIMIDTLISYEGICKNIDIELLKRIYNYPNLILIFEIIKVNFLEIGEREISIIKDFLRMVFNRIKIDEKLIQPIFKEIIDKESKKMITKKNVEINNLILSKKINKEKRKSDSILELN